MSSQRRRVRHDRKACTSTVARARLSSTWSGSSEPVNFNEAVKRSSSARAAIVERIGPSAAPALLLALEEPDHPWYYYRNILLMLAAVKPQLYEDYTQAVIDTLRAVRAIAGDEFLIVAHGDATFAIPYSYIHPIPADIT